MISRLSEFCRKEWPILVVVATMMAFMGCVSYLAVWNECTRPPAMMGDVDKAICHGFGWLR